MGDKQITKQDVQVLASSIAMALGQIGALTDHARPENIEEMHSVLREIERAVDELPKTATNVRIYQWVAGDEFGLVGSEGAAKRIITRILTAAKPDDPVVWVEDCQANYTSRIHALGRVDGYFHVRWLEASDAQSEQGDT